MLGEHVTSAFTDYPTAPEHVKAGRLRALAVASPARIAPLPDVPTVAESGFKDYDADLWYGIVAPAKTPKDTIGQLEDWFTGALQAPELKPKLGSRDSIRLEYVALSLAPISAENSRNTAASFARLYQGGPVTVGYTSSICRRENELHTVRRYDVITIAFQSRLPDVIASPTLVCEVPVALVLSEMSSNWLLLAGEW